MRSATLKRAIDIVGAAFTLVIFSVPLGLAAIAVRATLGRPILFRQTRPGMRAEPFELIKLRTMREAVGADGSQLPDADRLTGLGRFLRSTSIDELPELWCVIVGDMSLVGPRPLLMQYLGRYSPRQAKRHDVRPGITGLAQVSGRNATTWSERLELDARYVESWTVLGDLRIIWRTLGLVIRRQGIAAEGHATMPEFAGEDQSPDL